MVITDLNITATISRENLLTSLPFLYLTIRCVPFLVYLEFEDDKTSRQSSQQELHCEICCKKFLSAGTYHAHLKSKKHMLNRNKIKAPDAMSLGKSESSSDFSVIGAEKV